MATKSKAAKTAATQSADESRMQKIADSIQTTAEKLRDQVKSRLHDSGTKAKVRSVDMSITLIKLQRSVFDRAFKLLSSLQKQSDKLVKEHIQGADWMPHEGKDIVKEWSHMLNEGRVDFQKTIDKSYDLLRDCLVRVRKEQVAAGKKKASAKAVAAKKKSSPKKKSAPKKKPAAVVVAK